MLVVVPNSLLGGLFVQSLADEFGTGRTEVVVIGMGINTSSMYVAIPVMGLCDALTNKS